MGESLHRVSGFRHGVKESRGFKINESIIRTVKEGRELRIPRNEKNS